MELKDVIEKRRSIRSFTADEVPEEVLKELVKAASLAPSINNSQPWKFIAVTDADLLSRMADAVKDKIEDMFPPTESERDFVVKKTVSGFSSFFGNAPSMIIVLSRPYKAVIDKILDDTKYTHEEVNAIRNHPNIQTIGAAVENILLKAVDLGYGACWLTGLLVAREELEKIIEAPEDYSISACVAVGKPGEEPKPKIMKPLEEIFLLRS